MYKNKMSWWEYYVFHCWMTGWRTISSNFRVWADLMRSSYENYALPRTVEDPEAECLEWFWVVLNDDDVRPKQFLEYLMEMVDHVETGVIPLDENFSGRITDLTEYLKTPDEKRST